MSEARYYKYASELSMDELASKLPSESDGDVLDFGDHIVNIWRDAEGLINMVIHSGGSSASLIKI